MYAPVSSAHLSAQIIFLSRNESKVRSDVSALKTLGIRKIKHADRAEDIFSLLEKNVSACGRPLPEGWVLVCDEFFAEGCALTLAKSLAAKPSLARTPLLVLSASPAFVQEMREAGVHALARPYSMGGLSDAISEILSSKSAPFDMRRLGEIEDKSLKRKSVDKIATEPSEPSTTSDIFKLGMRELQQKEIDSAESRFLQVLSRNEEHVDACLALARIHRERGNVQTMRNYLLRAAASSLRMGDHKRAGMIAALLPERMRSDGGIMMFEAISRMEEGDFKAAALSFLDFCRVLPNTRLHSIIARACQLMPNPEEALMRVCSAYDSLGQTQTANKLRNRLLREFEGDYYLNESPSWLDRFPRLKEAVGVASYTARAWKHA